MADGGQQVGQVEVMETEKQAEKKKKRNVLIAIDGSKHAENAFKWFAEHIYNKDTDNVMLAFCAEMDAKLPTAALMGSPATIHALREEHEKSVKKVFQTFEKLANEYNVEHKLERVDHPHRPGEAIIKAAEQQDVHLIIAGSRGLGTVRRTILGSVSDYIIHHSHVPVIICKHEDEHHRLK
ncbi:universal stress protein Slr1101-like isoform X1 [Mercenaria mercenaria]|uniref:universal stress protein Slr1101-like isoform X1 n=1 Tax=Mercenaria mercenaria TaxID=6596 RepID=UPI00234FAB4A|nr:universal stress protein Slr1101-like isoform X1 [Mercenaria mercenaria]